MQQLKEVYYRYKGLIDPIAAGTIGFGLGFFACTGKKKSNFKLKK